MSQSTRIPSQGGRKYRPHCLEGASGPASHLQVTEARQSLYATLTLPLSLRQALAKAAYKPL
eukprot:150019-Amphidinium_carterae.1